MTPQNPYEAPKSQIDTAPETTHGVKSPYGNFRKNNVLVAGITLTMAFLIFCIIADIVIIYNRIMNAQGSAEPLSADISNYLSAIYDHLNIARIINSLIVIILWCVWTNRACKNGWFIRCQTGRFRQPGSEGTYTPGWSVGWFFVPILMLWKPFQAMLFIRDSSQSSHGKQHMGSLLGIWWGLWTTNTIANSVISSFSDNPESMEHLIRLQWTTIGFSIVPILAAIAAIAVAWRMTSIQNQQARKLRLN